MSEQNWKNAFGQQWDVPSFIQHLLAKGILKDYSGDITGMISPVFGIIDEKEGVELLLFVDHPWKDYRDGDNKRFGVTWGAFDKPEAVENFDELETALRKYFEIVAQYVRDNPGFRSNAIFRNWKDDPSGLLDKLFEEFTKQ